MTQKTFLSISFILILSILGGCGIKPSHVDPPAHVKNDTFPRTYPLPSNNP